MGNCLHVGRCEAHERRRSLHHDPMTPLPPPPVSDDDKPKKLPAGTPELASPAAAMAAGVTLRAEPDLQDAAVGLYDTQLIRFAVSDNQVGGSL